ncbi:hypothetical protein F0562_011911 [Nyssa sinensis]|uniref:Uncharacterized protein n=1 Tax=Nyssa sinensis TaxID=561372 RepID=A0A5J4ZQZ7_9ASTE|nr:hypothetical protein F0562_011911 [Nyssa sinensis]
MCGGVRQMGQGGWFGVFGPVVDQGQKQEGPHSLRSGAGGRPVGLRPKPVVLAQEGALLHVEVDIMWAERDEALSVNDVYQKNRAQCSTQMEETSGGEVVARRCSQEEGDQEDKLQGVDDSKLLESAYQE